MKKLGQLILFTVISIIFIPAVITIILGNNKPINENILISEKEQESKEKEIQSQEQLIGIVAKAMPIKYEEEAIKVQVIMARSYIAHLKGQMVPYMSIEEMKNQWGNDYNKNYTKIKTAVEDTKNIIMIYNDEPIQPVYHLQNTGMTQTPLDIWDLDVPYLESVESSWDEVAPDLVQEKEYSNQDLINKINGNYSKPAIEPYSLETQIQIIERTQGGYVKSIQVGNQLMNGDEFRKLLDLKSSCFVMNYHNNKVTFITKGVGHGVGLSQYGANQLAKEGKKAEEILKYYFPKVEIRLQK